MQFFLFHFSHSSIKVFADYLHDDENRRNSTMSETNLGDEACSCCSSAAAFVVIFVLQTRKLALLEKFFFSYEKHKKM